VAQLLGSTVVCFLLRYSMGGQATSTIWWLWLWEERAAAPAKGKKVMRAAPWALSGNLLIL
jgi:hypothetical protein